MCTAETMSGVQDLAGRVRQLAESGRGPDPESVRALLAEALSCSSDWVEGAYQELGEEDFRLYPIYRAPDGTCSMLIATLRPGVPLPVHNHGSWVVIGVYRGCELDTWYRRVDDAGVPGRAVLEVETSFLNNPGTVTVLPDGMIHTVEALSDRPAVSIHVYGTDIVTQERSTFDLEADTEDVFRPPFQTATESGTEA